MPESQLPSGEKVVHLDARLLKALAHPIRTQILGTLRRGGPATATTLAQRLDLDSGTTSYHLRQLAAAGLVVEDDTRGNQRDRWWKAAHDRTNFDDPDAVVNEPELTTTFMHNVARTSQANLMHYIDALPTLPKAWRKAGSMNDLWMHLTPAELTAMMSEFEETMEKYKALGREPRKGTREVIVQVNGFPRVESKS
jgi:DNA-binding transcriptional ArsR family regulator